MVGHIGAGSPPEAPAHPPATGAAPSAVLVQLLEPLLQVSGWFDYHAMAVLDTFNAVRASRSDHAAAGRVIIGPWKHEYEYWTATEIGEMDWHRDIAAMAASDVEFNRAGAHGGTCAGAFGGGDGIAGGVDAVDIVRSGGLGGAGAGRGAGQDGVRAAGGAGQSGAQQENGADEDRNPPG